jgi:hypothetical protein
MPLINRVTQQDRDRKTIAAIRKYLVTLQSILIAGVTYTPDQLIALFQKDADLADAATRARGNLFAAAQAASAQRTLMRPVLVGFRSFLHNQFSDPSIVAEFGFTPRKQGKPSVETKATAAVKAKATRVARHTLGKNQKQAIKGDVLGVVEMPVTSSANAGAPSASAPAPSAPAAAPAPAGASQPPAPASPLR